MLKAQGWPDSRDAENWRADACGFRAQAANRFAPSMRHRLDLARIYRRALPQTMDGRKPQSLPEGRPATLDQLLSDQP